MHSILGSQILGTAILMFAGIGIAWTVSRILQVVPDVR
jgi:hypothetical protein